jgi:thioredoxin-related protein
MSKDRTDNFSESQLRNPVPFQEEIWNDRETSSLYGVRAGEDKDSWKKYIGADKTDDVELIEPPKDIEFSNKIFDGFKRALAEGKPLVVEFSQEKCHWCNKLDNETFKSDEMRELRDKAIWIRVDPDKDEDDKGNVNQLAKDLGIDRYPTTVVLDVKENSLAELGRVVGYFDGKKMAENMKQILPQSQNSGEVIEFSKHTGDQKSAA